MRAAITVAILAAASLIGANTANATPPPICHTYPGGLSTCHFHK